MMRDVTLLDRLNSLTPYHYQYGVWMDDIIADYPLDTAAMEAADPDGTNRIIILEDGTQYRFDDATGQWNETEPV